MKQKIPKAVILEALVNTDWRFGVSAIDNETKVATGNWIPYLPTEERQNREHETMACTNFSSTNCVETLMNWKIKEKRISVGNLQWLYDNGYIDEQGNFNSSDRFDALVSNTSPQWGNTLKAPADAKRKFGLIPEKMLPWTSNTMEYYDRSKITPEMYVLGQELLKRFPINYEFVDKKDLSIALRISPLSGACYAWNGTNNGVYYESGQNINHAIAIIEPADIWQIFDSYDPHIKRLATNYNFYDYAVRYIVGENTDVPDGSTKKNMYTLHRDPKNPKEVYAFNETKTVKRHITNKSTLVEGAKKFDQFWVWSENTPVPVTTPEIFDGATEMAEILLLSPDSNVIISTGSKWSLWSWIKGLFGK